MCTLPFIQSFFLIVLIHQLNNVDFFQKVFTCKCFVKFLITHSGSLHLYLHPKPPSPFLLYSLVTSYQVSKISMEFFAKLLDITKKIQGNTLLLNIYSNPSFSFCIFIILIFQSIPSLNNRCNLDYFTKKSTLSNMYECFYSMVNRYNKKYIQHHCSF